MQTRKISETTSLSFRPATRMDLFTGARSIGQNVVSGFYVCLSIFSEEDLLRQRR
jgi:hypothetical protein